MTERLIIDRDRGTFNPNPVDKGSGKSGQIKTATSTWFGKTIKVKDANRLEVKLNKGSLIDFLKTTPEGKRLKKGFLCFNRSNDKKIRTAFENFVTRVNPDRSRSISDNTPQGQFINQMTDTMKNEFKDINEVSSATCFVKITKDGQSNIHQYILTNEDNSSINMTDFAARIDEIGKNLNAETPFVHSISQQWVIISKLPNGEFYIADGDRSFSRKKLKNGWEEHEGGGGSHGGSRNKEGLNVAAFRLKPMGIEINKIYADKQFVQGPYFYDLNSTEVVKNQIDQDMEKVVTSMRLKLQDLGNTPIQSAKCIVKTYFPAHAQESNFTVETIDNTGNLFRKLENIQDIHIQECKKLPYGVPLKTEWVWLIEDQDKKDLSCNGDFTPTGRGDRVEFGSGTSGNFRI